MISIGGKLYYTDGTNIQGPAITHPAEIDRRRIRRSKYDTSHFFEDKNGNMTMEQLSNNIQASTDTHALDLKYAKSRTVFSEEQMLIMETAYRKHGTPDQSQRLMIAELCGLAEETVRIWYQNRRAKEKRQHEDDLAFLAKKMTERSKQSNELTIDQKVNNIFNGNGDPSKVDTFRSLFQDDQPSTQRKRPVRIYETKTNKCETERKRKLAAKKVKLENNYESSTQSAPEKALPPPAAVSKKKAQPKNISEVNFIKNLMREKDAMKPAFPVANTSSNKANYSEGGPLLSISYPLGHNIKEELDAQTNIAPNLTNHFPSMSSTNNSTNHQIYPTNSYYQANEPTAKTPQTTAFNSWDTTENFGLPKISNVTTLNSQDIEGLQPVKDEIKKESCEQQQQQQQQQQQTADGGTYLNISADMTLQQMNDMILHQQNMIAYYQQMIDNGEMQTADPYGYDAVNGAAYQDTTNNYAYDNSYAYGQQQQQQPGTSSSYPYYPDPSTNYDSTLYPHQKNFEDELMGMLNEYPTQIKTEEDSDFPVYPKIDQQWSLSSEYSDQVCPPSSNISTTSSMSAFTKPNAEGESTQNAVSSTTLNYNGGKDGRLDLSNDSCDSDDGSAVKKAMNELRCETLDAPALHASSTATSIKVEEEDTCDAEVSGITKSAEESRQLPVDDKEESNENGDKVVGDDGHNSHEGHTQNQQKNEELNNDEDLRRDKESSLIVHTLPLPP